MKIKTAELIDLALYWAVAESEGNVRLQYDSREGMIIRNVLGWIPYRPSVAWVQGGPIIEREKLCVGYRHQLDPEYVPLLDPATVCWARTTAGGYLNYGPTPLIAAMRCFVASKLGDEVDVPEELCLKTVAPQQ